MKIMEGIKAMFFGTHPTAGERRLTQKVDAAIQAADDVANQSRAVNAKLKGYLEQQDPMMALLIDISNERASRAQIRQWDK